MKKSYNNHGGVNIIIVILLILIAVMLVIISIPARKAFEYRSECIACEQAMKSAGDGLIIEYLHRQEGSDIKEARNTILDVMPGREHICPKGGNIYLILNDKDIYEPICGLHCSDKPLRTRLNASYAQSLLTEVRAKNMKDSATEPTSITINTNSKPLKCYHVTKEEKIHRGTKTTNGYKGIVAYYGVAGDFTFSSRFTNKGMGKVEDGDICYFLYADENYCAIWRSCDGWDGDAYTSESK
jgi:cell division protein FtsL